MSGAVVLITHACTKAQQQMSATELQYSRVSQSEDKELLVNSIDSCLVQV